MGWLTADETAQLTATYTLLWQVQAAARLLTGSKLEIADLGEGGRSFLLRQTGEETMEVLAARLAEATAASAQIIDAALEREPVSR